MVAFADLSLSFLFGLSGLTKPDTSSGSLDTRNVLRSTVCEQIAANVSSSSVVYYSGSSQYTKDNYHWSSSSSQTSKCSFEPATTEDIGIAIKSGGHATNAGFSSTSGVEIAMYSFSDIVYNSSAQTATLGTGAIWDDVYVALEKYNMTVVGPKITGIGIGGIVLGGGYSYLTNQYGMSIDSVVAYELVMPNGTVAEITDSTNPDLFFALRVSFQRSNHSQVWGGLITYGKDQWDAASAAIANYSANVTDPKASIYNAYNYVAGVAVMANMLFYDAPARPEGIFDEFLSIDAIYEDISTRTYVDLIQSFPLNGTAGLRSVFSSMAMEDVTVPVLDMIMNETLTRGPELADNASAVFVTYSVDVFLPTLYDHVDSPTAYPPSRSQGYSYIEIYCEVLTSYGQDIADVAVYPNHAPPGTSLEKMYGSNVPRLQAIKNAVDPDNVMALTGGWKF
ncbi:FAD-binding domain-containing protein [Suillus subalutaceus]|uniref:FAD-binding domain-containing protein n=1 Tax=Suillus subalutaceus TaxID=48586 RepID=UPI001B867F53|nr:FAD-binding domain-containing protein [Suillus subalutaceus]KAG1839889.1 FAD-binding domain-containing protein [Suillus subalutaceus]